MDLPTTSALYRTCLPVAGALDLRRIVPIDSELTDLATLVYPAGTRTYRANLAMLGALARGLRERGAR